MYCNQLHSRVVENKPFCPIVTFLSWLSSLNLVSLASKIMGYIFFLTHSEKLLQIPPIDYCSSSTSNRWGLSVHFKIQMLIPETLKAYHDRTSYLAHYKKKIFQMQLFGSTGLSWYIITKTDVASECNETGKHWIKWQPKSNESITEHFTQTLKNTYSSQLPKKCLQNWNII